MAILKREYELSIWDERLDLNGNKIEKKGAIIGAHDMDYLGRAVNIKLKREIKGTNTLTFDMPQKYFDSKLGRYVKNELIDELYNEKKVKLNFDGQWFEFYIKSINEKKEFKSIMKSFTCQDSFIDELSRTGYEILFDEELYNNVDEISPFMEIILEDSIWDYRPDLNIGDFTEFTEERFYKIPLKQFGGTISAYPIKLEVKPEYLKEESTYYKKIKEKDKNFNLNNAREKEVVLKNIYTNNTRSLELGDDLSYRKEIFWDAHRTDNGFSLLNKNEKIILEGDYIYVAYSDLSFIYGSIYEDPYKSTEEPAQYGCYNQELGYALQPSSKDPSALIQFIFFNENDEVFIDESGTIANNNCHYVITVEEWNGILKSIYENKDLSTNEDKGLIYWKTTFIDGGKLTEKYEINNTENVIYTKNVIPNNSTIDDFTWYPVYYEDYLSEINGQEVFAARKISVTDRTEFNLKSEYYTTIYSNNAEEYIGLYSEIEKDNERDEENFLKTNDFRVQSKEATRIVVPTLARNLITNGNNITTNDGWEALTQNNQTEYNTGSYSNLLEINVKTTTQSDHFYEMTGETSDEGISDYYLEFLSPNIEKCDNFSSEGEVSSDYALNFGLTELENGIEKDKIYAIRICTGNWKIINYDIIFRKDLELINDTEAVNIKKECTEIEAENYKNALKTYNEALYNNDIILHDEKLTINSDINDFKELIKLWIQEHDVDKTEFEKWSNVTIESEDYKYLINRLYIQLNQEQKTENDKNDAPEQEDENDKIDIPEQYTESLNINSYEAWEGSCIFANQIFNKSYNQDLNKIIIGQGSIDINGNYEVDGIQNLDSNKFISFSDIFDKIEDENNEISHLYFAGYNEEEKSGIENSSLLKTLYHSKKNGEKQWIWTKESIEDGLNIEDNAFLLFKAKTNITSPYLGILSESEPMTIQTDNLTIKTYADTDMSGIKLETKGTNMTDNKDYFVDNAQYTIYIVDNENFSSNFLNRVGITTDSTENGEDKGNEDESDENNKDENTSNNDKNDKDENTSVDNNIINENVKLIVPQNDESEIEIADTYDLMDGDLLPDAKPEWTGVSASTLPLFFQNVTENPDKTGSNKYALFVNDLYYGIFWLDKKILNKDENDEIVEDDKDKDEIIKEDKDESINDNGGE